MKNNLTIFQLIKEGNKKKRWVLLEKGFHYNDINGIDCFQKLKEMITE